MGTRGSVVVGMVLLWGLTLQPAWAGTRMIPVSGTVDDSKATVKVNGLDATVNPDGTWSVDIRLDEGGNTITATATDQAGNGAEASVTVTLDTVPPVLVISFPTDDKVFGAE